VVPEYSGCQKNHIATDLAISKCAIIMMLGAWLNWLNVSLNVNAFLVATMRTISFPLLNKMFVMGMGALVPRIEGVDGCCQTL
jgi:hypothetical protein